MLHPRHKRYLKQIIPFAIIWLIFGLVYSFVEVGLLGSINYYPSTGNQYDFQTNLTFTSIGCLVMGLFQGWIEVVWLRKQFEQKALWVKILTKSIFYIFLIILFLTALTTINSMLSFNEGVLDEAVLRDLERFVTSFAFWSIIIYISVALTIALFFSEISDYLGNGVFYNFLFNKYHKPKQETRIFMFLDMKSSTTIAEQIGHKRYFDLIKSYYADMTNAILETSGEVYQYVGDEIVISWPQKLGLYNNNCIECFHKIDKAFNEKEGYYTKTFGLVPDYKAGYHIGEVTTGEIGIIKKDIIYTGDVLNTTARIQGECNNYNARLLISEVLVEKLSKSTDFSFTKIGKLMLRGKTEAIQLYSGVL